MRRCQHLPMGVIGAVASMACGVAVAQGSTPAAPKTPAANAAIQWGANATQPAPAAPPALPPAAAAPLPPDAKRAAGAARTVAPSALSAARVAAAAPGSAGAIRPAGNNLTAASAPSAQVPRGPVMTPPRAAAGAAARPSASLKAAKPDLGSLATTPVRVVRIPSARPNPPAGAALQAANQQVLADARAVPLRDSGTGLGQSRRKDSVSSVNTALPMGTNYGQSCIPGNVGAPKGVFTPGGTISIRGCDLGSRRGELRMLGRFADGAVQLAIVEWTPQVVVASVPGDLRGVEDQAVRIQLVTHDGKALKEQAVQFLARREVLELPESLVTNTNCAHPQPALCEWTTMDRARWAAGGHWGLDSQRGRDEWRLYIGPSWQLERIEFRLLPGSSEPVAQPRAPAQQLVTVDWESADIGAGYYKAHHALRFFVTGPAGVAFTAGLN